MATIGESQIIEINGKKFKLVPIEEADGAEAHAEPATTEPSEEIPAPNTPPPPPPTEEKPTEEPTEQPLAEEKQAEKPPQEPQPKNKRLQKSNETVSEDGTHTYIYMRPRLLKPKAGQEPIIKYSQVIRSYKPKAQNETLAHKRRALTHKIVQDIVNELEGAKMSNYEFYEEYCDRMNELNVKPYVLKSFLEYLV